MNFKTRGYPLKENTHEYYRLQMDCYSLLLEKSGMKSAGYAILLFYHPLKVNREHHVEFQATPYKLITNPIIAQTILNTAIFCLQGKEPKASGRCGYCNWEGHS